MVIKNVKQAKGLIGVCIIQIFTMIGFMYLFSLMTLYCTQKFYLSDHQAYILFAAYGSIVFGLPLFGGYLGDKFLTHKKAVLYSIPIQSLALILMSINNIDVFYFALAIFAISTCLQTPNIYCLVGELYSIDHPKRQQAFALAYIAVNLGAVFATGTAGFLSQKLGYGMTFIIGGILNFGALIGYFLCRNEIKNTKDDSRLTIYGFLLLIMSIFICMLLFHYSEICNLLILAFAIGITLLLIFLSFRQSAQIQKNLLIFIFITWVAVGFGALFVLTPTVLTLFIERNVNRHFFSILIPTPTIMIINSLIIVFLGPFISLKDKKAKPDSSLALKFSLGIILMGISFVVLVLGICFSNQFGVTALIWIAICYILQAFAELYVNPIGYSLSHSLAPKGMEASLLGFFQLNFGLASAIMSYFSLMATDLQGNVNPLITNKMYLQAFSHYSLFSISLGIVCFVVLRIWFRKPEA